MRMSLRKRRRFGSKAMMRGSFRNYGNESFTSGGRGVRGIGLKRFRGRKFI